MKKRYHAYQTRQQMHERDYEIFYYSDSKLEKVSLHHHDFYECFFFISGNVSYYIEGKTYALKPGDIVLVDTTELHQLIVMDHSIPYERIVLWIDKSFLNSLSTDQTDLASCFYAKKDNVIRLSLDLQQTIRTILHKLISIENYTGIGSDILYKSYFIELFVQINMALLHNNIRPDADVKKSIMITGIIEYINNHIEEELTIDSLSEHVFLSKYHLLREFKKHSGTTIHKYIIQKKLILAKELILKGMPITEVFKQCGFGDYSNFFRAFKKEYGVTPKFFYSTYNQDS
ncbi:HTH-type transcriptional activator RhaS [Ruminiclostridium hungatei]|uniref:HTH-type transcriptional activator RhaS n=1 Tax=Ruminiclostridium hungatei TaxID=48256 RepID=A0A1V4SP74_RUMHU|nr:AraC family transcriptional regulator [Ruminiclostridium hungatei]OPX45603.1 HTH-type transcriptional activator RhaS [Ruminiclostridium hungatei]